MEGLRRTFGMAEPIRRGMELKLTAAGEWRPAAVGGASNVHGDILAGRDTEIGWEDVYKGEFSRPPHSLDLVFCCTWQIYGPRLITFEC